MKAFDFDVNVVASTGYSNYPAVLDFNGHGFSVKLSKSYKINELKVILEQMIKKQGICVGSSIVVFVSRADFSNRFLYYPSHILVVIIFYFQKGVRLPVDP